MRKVKEILRMKWVLGLPHRAIARALGASISAISKLASRATAAGLDWATVEGLSEEEIEKRLYLKSDVPAGQRNRPLPDFAYLHAERRKPGVTLQLLHLEYMEGNPEGYGYTQFCEYYRQWLANRGLTMRQDHCAGEKVFVDYSGKKPKIVDPITGVETEVELFVGALGASNYTFAEATLTQQVADFIGSHVRMFEFFGGLSRDTAGRDQRYRTLNERPHPEQGYRSCLGILRLSARYGEERLERACGRAMQAGARSYRHVESILKNGLDRLETAAPAAEVQVVAHENVRGAAYYEN